MENNEYLNKLIEQFKTVRGITANTYSVEFINEFKDWLLHIQLLGDEYGRQLGKNCIYFADESYAEVGKGPKDSIVIKYEDTDTTIISPYFEGYKEENPYRKIMNSSFEVTGDIPTLIKEKGDEVGIRVIKPNDIKVFMTHNPYSLDGISNWIELHNNPDNGIIVGMFGYTYDKDYTEKVKYIESLRNKTYIPFKYDSFTVGDKYFSMFSTDMYEKSRVLAKRK